MGLIATAEILPDLPDRITVECSYRAKDAVKAIPGAKWNPETRKWTVPLTWPACLALRTEFGSGLVIEPDLRAWAMEIAPKKATLLERRNDLDTGATHDLPGFAELYPPQVVDAELMAEAGSYLLMNETGSGKSRSALGAISLLSVAKNVFPLMIVAPKSMLVTWRREVARFFPDRDCVIAAGTPAKIKKALADPTADIFVIGWESLRKYSRLAPFGSMALTVEQKTPKEIQELGPRTLVFDECHRACNPKAARTRAAWAVSEGAKYRFGLTGSPMEESAENLYGILHLLFPEEYPTKTNYVERYLEIDYNEWGGREIIGIHPLREVEFQKNFRAVSRRLTKAVMHPFLPEKINEVRWVDLPPKLRKAYDDMSTKLVAELDGAVITAENALVKAGRLIQLANAAGEIDGEGKFHMTGGSPKVEQFMDDVIDGDYDTEQVVVFSDSRELIEVVDATMTKAGIEFVKITGSVTGDDRQAAMDTFQEGKVQFCLLTRAGGEGITLTAASTMVRLVRPWSYRVFTQAEDRVHRIGSEIHDVIRYVDYITEDTLEMGQMARLNGKGATAEEVLRDRDLLKLIKEPPRTEDLL